MRLVFLVVLVTFVAATAIPVVAQDKDRTTRNKWAGGSEPGCDFIYDLTHPWPFHKRGASAIDSDGDGVGDDVDRCPNTPAGAAVDRNGCPVDSDGDGVYDGIDQCTNTPRGATVDSKGCPSDSDGDGVYDGIDQCKNTPRGIDVDSRGCPKDSDRDGVPDGVDACRDTPAGATVDSRGCPKDSDGDGVYDGIDRCANTPANSKVDEFGCPLEMSDMETEFLDTGMIRTSNIRFETGKAELKRESRKTIDEIGTIMVQWPKLRIEIGGHTDAQGSAANNQALSERRANAVLDYLKKNFPKIQQDNFSVKGYGEKQPVASNDTAAGRAENRRVEFKVLNRETLKREIERRRDR